MNIHEKIKNLGSEEFAVFQKSMSKNAVHNPLLSLIGSLPKECILEMVKVLEEEFTENAEFSLDKLVAESGVKLDMDRHLEKIKKAVETGDTCNIDYSSEYMNDQHAEHLRKLGYTVRYNRACTWYEISGWPTR